MANYYDEVRRLQYKAKDVINEVASHDQKNHAEIVLEARENGIGREKLIGNYGLMKEMADKIYAKYTDSVKSIAGVELSDEEVDLVVSAIAGGLTQKRIYDSFAKNQDNVFDLETFLAPMTPYRNRHLGHLDNVGRNECDMKHEEFVDYVLKETDVEKKYGLKVRKEEMTPDDAFELMKAAQKASTGRAEDEKDLVRILQTSHYSNVA